MLSTDDKRGSSTLKKIEPFVIPMALRRPLKEIVIFVLVVALQRIKPFIVINLDAYMRVIYNALELSSHWEKVIWLKRERPRCGRVGGR
jgi:hypothetical protein